mgnify:CR=1 FL=1
MQEKTVVAVDAMGGDNAPGEIVRGALDAIGRRGDIKVILVGNPKRFRRNWPGLPTRRISWRLWKPLR